MEQGLDTVITDERAADDRYRRALSRNDRAHLGRALAEKGLIGRAGVGGTEFLVGSRSVTEGRLRVVSWAAPGAATFFRGSHATRTLIRRRGQIVDRVDDGPAPTTRAERALLAAIGAPRRDRLSGVLTTLQPEQYDLVTADPAGPLVVQGAPGTGKTVVATHRAAWLVHPESPHSHDRVLLVGPTQHYRHHVRGLLTELVEDGRTVEVSSLTDVLAGLSGVSVAEGDNPPMGERDGDTYLAQLAERAFHMLGSVPADGVQAVYEALRANRAGTHEVTRDPGWREHLRALPPFATARRTRRLLPLLAACAALLPGRVRDAYDHVIVDEAQDLTPLEWAVLRELNPSGSWTLLGDTSRRRAESSCQSWSHVEEVLGLPDAATATLRRGYRTSAAIMAFASRLLPRLERTVSSLQAGGAPPLIEEVQITGLSAGLARATTALLDRLPEGTVAILTLSATLALRELRKAGFTVDARDSSKLLSAGRALRVLHPEEARSLEFDAVVVVEPGVFPTRMGRHGLLYTALTRAHRELVIVHSQPLPPELRSDVSSPPSAQASR